MRISVNGEPREVAAGTTVAQLLEVLSIKSDRVAIELNLSVVRREARDQVVLNEDDRLEIVSFVGGGA